ncbi:MAG: MoaD/ThiS family protein [Nitrospirales bacterium]|nr:MoaD/ThiS family protein [Nitrospirales bacterium]
MVKVLIFGHALREVVEDPEVEISLEEPTTLRALLEGHPEHFQSLMPFLQSQQVMFTINQKISTWEAKVQVGDTVKITHQGGDQHSDGAMWHNP